MSGLAKGAKPRNRVHIPVDELKSRKDRKLCELTNEFFDFLRFVTLLSIDFCSFIARNATRAIWADLKKCLSAAKSSSRRTVALVHQVALMR